MGSGLFAQHDRCSGTITMVAMKPGERMLIPCSGGGLCISRLVDYPPPLQAEQRSDMYILVDDGPPDQWRYDWVPERPLSLR